MNVPKFKFLIATVDYTELYELNKIYSTDHDYNKWKELKQTFSNVGIELLGTLEYFNGKVVRNNLIYYDPDYTDDYFEKYYPKNLDEIFDLYEEKLYIDLDEKIAIFGSPCGFSFISTYAINDTLKKFRNGLYEFEPGKELLDIKELDNVLYMVYDGV
jgi:hypothetical protein